VAVAAAKLLGVESKQQQDWPVSDAAAPPVDWRDVKSHVQAWLDGTENDSDAATACVALLSAASLGSEPSLHLLARTLERDNLKTQVHGLVAHRNKEKAEKTVE
jgi:hypothetical protein